MQVNENQENEKVKSLKHRIYMLKQRIELQEKGPEVDISRKILSKLEAEYEILKKDEDVFIPEATGIKRLNDAEERKMLQKIGVLYWIFGPTYEETVSYKRYRIEFLQLLPNDKLDMGCLMRVKVHIYENDQPFMMKDVVLEFWKGWSDSTEIDDIGISCNDRDIKYNNCHWFLKIEYSLAKTWNKYFKPIPLMEAKQSGLLEASETRYLPENRGK